MRRNAEKAARRRSSQALCVARTRLLFVSSAFFLASASCAHRDVDSVHGDPGRGTFRSQLRRRRGVRNPTIGGMPRAPKRPKRARLERNRVAVRLSMNKLSAGRQRLPRSRVRVEGNAACQLETTPHTQKSWFAQTFSASIHLRSAQKARCSNVISRSRPRHAPPTRRSCSRLRAEIGSHGVARRRSHRACRREPCIPRAVASRPWPYARTGKQPQFAAAAVAMLASPRRSGRHQESAFASGGSAQERVNANTYLRGYRDTCNPEHRPSPQCALVTTMRGTALPNMVSEGPRRRSFTRRTEGCWHGILRERRSAGPASTSSTATLHGRRPKTPRHVVTAFVVVFRNSFLGDP